jgi:uncharacterized membrane protein YphA (DoxX/SURF4 family)
MLFLNTLEGDKMKSNGLVSRMIRTDQDSKMIVIRLIVGLIFISEGILKYKLIQWMGPGRFELLGFSHAAFWAYFTGAFEITCGVLVLSGYMTRAASIPLLTIMIVAFITTKIPLLMEKGFWTFAHEYTTDMALTLLLVLLIIYGGGKWSVDERLGNRR